jgi:hypothetical protein
MPPAVIAAAIVGAETGTAFAWVAFAVSVVEGVVGSRVGGELFTRRESPPPSFVQADSAPGYQPR